MGVPPATGGSDVRNANRLFQELATVSNCRDMFGARRPWRDVSGGVVNRGLPEPADLRVVCCNSTVVCRGNRQVGLRPIRG